MPGILAVCVTGSGTRGVSHDLFLTVLDIQPSRNTSQQSSPTTSERPQLAARRHVTAAGTGDVTQSDLLKPKRLHAIVGLRLTALLSDSRQNRNESVADQLIGDQLTRSHRPLRR